MANEPDLIFDLSPEKPSNLATRNPQSQNAQEQPFSFFSDPLFIKSPSDVSNAALSENEAPKIENRSEHTPKADKKQTMFFVSESSSGKKFFIRTVGFGDKAVSTSAPFTSSIKF